MRFVQADGRSAHVSAGIKARCADPVFIPPNPSEEEQWRIMGQDRKALVDCSAKNDAKAATIEALEGQAAR